MAREKLKKLFQDECSFTAQHMVMNRIASKVNLWINESLACRKDWRSDTG